MSVEAKIKALKENKERLNAYRRAMDTLRATGVEEILTLLALPDPVDVTSNRGTHMAAAALHESLGYQKCLGDLFGLEDLVFGTGERPLADYGANEKLGVSESEARKFV